MRKPVEDRPEQRDERVMIINRRAGHDPDDRPADAKADADQKDAGENPNRRPLLKFA
jgi:hypothetical protein